MSQVVLFRRVVRGVVQLPPKGGAVYIVCIDEGRCGKMAFPSCV